MSQKVNREKFFVVNLGVVITLILQEFVRHTLGFGELYHFQTSSQREKQKGKEIFRQVEGKFTFCHHGRKTSMLFSILLRKGEEERWMLKQFLSVSFHTGSGWKKVDLSQPKLARIREMRGRVVRK